MSTIPPWLQQPQLDVNSSDYQSYVVDYDCGVIGAGIAGASCAYEFAKQGLRVLVLEKNEEPAQEGSGNPQGMLYLKLSSSDSWQNRLLIEGFHYTRSVLKSLTAEGLLTQGDDWDDCGLLQLASAERKPERQTQLAHTYPKELLYPVTKSAAENLANVELASDGLFFPDSGWVAPRAFVLALLNHPNITVKNAQTVRDIQRLQISEKAPLWSVITDKTSFKAKIIIQAMGKNSGELLQTANIPYHFAKGQTSTISTKTNLQVVVSGRGYIAPSIQKDGQFQTTFGATFHHGVSDVTVTEEDHRENLQMLQENSPELWRTIVEETNILDSMKGRAACRVSVMGSLPVVGPIANYSAFMQAFARIRLDAKAIPQATVPWEYGLYLSTAHGARGMITAPLSAKLLVMSICGNAAMNEANTPALDLLVQLHPNRFYYRELRFGKSSD